MSIDAIYYLSSHAYACEVGGHAVFLDLKRDKYTAIAPEDVGALRRMVRGWRPSADVGGIERETGVNRSVLPDPSELIADLTREGLITGDASRGHAATGASLEAPRESFVSTQRVWPALTPRLIRQYAAAWLITTLLLKTWPIHRIVARAVRRKTHRVSHAGPFDPQRAAHLAAVHALLQPVFYNGHDACLRNSLTLIEFLAQSDLYPLWAFGVRMNPFAAHSWVQQGPWVFTDPVEHVKSFTPILVI